MAQRPPRDVNWIPDDSTGISVPGSTKQAAGWIVEKPPRQFFNWMWNRCSRWFHYNSGQSQEYIIIDSVNTNEKDYDTLVAYIAGTPVAGDKVLVKEDQTVTVQTILPADITIKFLDGVRLLCATDIATSVLKLGNNPIIEGVLKIVLSQAGTTAKAVEIDGDNAVGKINVENSSIGTLTTAYHINANKTGNRVNGEARNVGGGTLTNVLVDNSTEDSNMIELVDEPNNQIRRSRGAYKFREGLEFDLGSDANGDIYYRNAGILKRLAKGTNADCLILASGIPSWQTLPSFSVHRNGTQQVNITSADKIEWTTEEWDTNSDFDSATNYRFTPTVALKYLFCVSITWNNVIAGDQVKLYLYKNGALFKRIARDIHQTAINSLSMSVIVDANGTTDYFEIFAENSNRNTADIRGESSDTYWNGQGLLGA